MTTNCPCASVIASASGRPPSRRATFTFGAARPATTACPVGSTLTTSKDGLIAGEAGIAADAVRSRASVVGAGGFAATVTTGGTGCCQRKPGWAK